MDPISWLIGIAIAAVAYFSGRSNAKRQQADEIDRLNKRIADLEDGDPTNPTA
jgi:hypothetical protein